MKKPVEVFTGMVVTLLMTASVFASDTPQSILITGARIFDGVSAQLIDDQDVLIQDGKIRRVAAAIAVPPETRVIDAAGRVKDP